MKIGTRSVLYGYHCFFLHPWFVALAWFKLHGWRRVKIGYYSEHSSIPGIGPNAFVRVRRYVWTSLYDPRLWLAFFLHDLGYVGCPNMDGPEGEAHPYWAARLMQRWFGNTWGEFCRYHSRFLARRDGRDPSLLCAPDKLAIALYPVWLFLFLVRVTGEIEEYMRNSKVGTSPRAWALDCQRFAREYAEKMRAGGTDTLTGTAADSNTQERVARATGVWT